MRGLVYFFPARVEISIEISLKRGDYMVLSAKQILLTAASVSLALTQAATADDRDGDRQRGNPYVAGDMHNHNTCTDGSVSAGYATHRSVATCTAPRGGHNLGLALVPLGNPCGARHPYMR